FPRLPASLLPLLLASEDVDTSWWLADPEGAAHGCAAFFYKTWMSCRKIPATMTSRICPGHKAFSLVRFFDAYQRNELGRAAGETLLIFCLSGIRTQSRQVQKSEAFAFGDFISFDERQKKRKQRKTLPRTRQTRLFIGEGIFLHDIHVV